MTLLGTSLAKRDNLLLATGRARFTGDIVRPGMLHGKMVRSPYAHARILSVDASHARALPGVVDVIVPEDTRGLARFSTAHIRDQEVLCTTTARFVGDPVAAVFAETEELAEAAADLVAVEYEELPLVLDPEAAVAPGAPLLHPEQDGLDGNICYRQVVRAGDVETAFARADLVLEERFRTSKQHAMPMETHAVLAAWDPEADELTLWVSTQQAHLLRDTLAQVIGLPANRIRVIKPFVGGAFGHKEGLHSHEALAALAALRTGRPVRFVLSRAEEFGATVSRNPQVRDVRLAVAADGTVLAWQERILQDCGAYAGLGPSVLALSAFVTPGPYRTPAIDIEGRLTYTNKPPASAFRGFGNPQATFAREVAFDMAARRLGLDPLDFRRRNLIPASALPMVTVTGLRLATLPVMECLERAVASIDYDGLRAHPRPWRGVGLATMLEWGGGCRWHPEFDADMSSVTVSMGPDGGVSVMTDAADSGQGHATLFTQIVCDALGVAPGDVAVVLADTARTPFGQGTYGSRTAVVHGTALQRACERLLVRLREVAGHLMEARPEDLVASGGRLMVRGTDRGVAIGEVAAAIHFDRRRLPAGTETGALVETASYDTPCEVPDELGIGNFAANYTCSATVAVVDVDPDTGRLSVVDWATAEDVGRALNPDIVTTQIQGGIAQGIGYALGEELLFDEAGTILNASMADYQVPTCPVIPPIERHLIHVESHDPTHAFGHKGIGESGITPAAAAIANAVFDAIGVPITSLPLSPEKVLAALDLARSAGAR
jgi:aerobic carbon-monoxide dehydrogenase large subunit